jgi:hypothetical protein
MPGPRCLRATPADAKFCPACSANLPVIFCDLVALTALSPQLDPIRFSADLCPNRASTGYMKWGERCIILLPRLRVRGRSQVQKGI